MAEGVSASPYFRIPFGPFLAAIRFGPIFATLLFRPSLRDVLLRAGDGVFLSLGRFGLAVSFRRWA